eukprot:6212898-Pleurochrysis_carterae.AAC.14
MALSLSRMPSQLSRLAQRYADVSIKQRRDSGHDVLERCAPPDQRATSTERVMRSSASSACTSACCQRSRRRGFCPSTPTCIDPAPFRAGRFFCTPRAFSGSCASTSDLSRRSRNGRSTCIMHVNKAFAPLRASFGRCCYSIRKSDQSANEAPESGRGDGAAAHTVCALRIRPHDRTTHAH